MCIRDRYINDLNDFIKSRGGNMWMWGDQLIDGYLVPSSNPGYETCVSSLHKAVDLISKDILICDWHYYDEPLGQLSPAYWVVKGLPFITCAFNSVHAVSYTHLDVYKRQTPNLTRFSIRNTPGSGS